MMSAMSGVHVEVTYVSFVRVSVYMAVTKQNLRSPKRTR